MYTNPGASSYNFNNIIDSSSSGVAGAAIGILVAIGVIILLIVLVFCILTVIINWKLLKKMGNEGWKAIIPIYNTWSLCQGVGICPHWSWITVVASAFLSNIPGFGPLIASAVGIYFGVIYYIALARSFGKDDGYAVLLFFFFPIVGFFLLKEEYLGAKGCHDVVFDDWIKINEKKPAEAEVVNETKSSEDKKEEKEEKKSEEKDGKFCTACGHELKEDTKFCPSCGKEV